MSTVLVLFGISAMYSCFFHRCHGGAAHAIATSCCCSDRGPLEQPARAKTGTLITTACVLQVVAQNKGRLVAFSRRGFSFCLRQRNISGKNKQTTKQIRHSGLLQASFTWYLFTLCTIRAKPNYILSKALGTVTSPDTQYAASVTTEQSINRGNIREDT